MTPQPQPTKPATATADPSAIPGFANVIRGLAHVPKAEVDAAMAKDKVAKKRRGAK
jgi:hypothetical protein